MSKEVNKEKLKALQLTLDKLEKTYGKGTIMKLGDEAVEKMEVVPTGSLTLDLALGVGGFPKGRIIEIYGPESSGKTTLAMHVISEAQKKGGIAAFIDAEHAFDKRRFSHSRMSHGYRHVTNQEVGQVGHGWIVGA